MNDTRVCNQCGGSLVFIKEVIEDRDMPSAVKTAIYHCKDKTCQKEIDRKSRERIKHFKEQEEAKKNRYKNRQLQG